MKSKTLLLGLLGAVLLSAAVVSPTVAEPQTKAGSKSGIVAKCREKYPETGTALERRRSLQLRKQCIASGGKT